MSFFTRCTVYIQMSLFAGTWYSLIHQKHIYLFFICHNLISLLPIKAVPLSSLSVVSFSLLTDLCDSYWRALVVYQTYIPCYFICWFKVCQLCMSLSFLSYMSSSFSSVILSLFIVIQFPSVSHLYGVLFCWRTFLFDILFHYSYVSLSTCIYQSFLLIGYFFFVPT